MIKRLIFDIDDTLIPSDSYKVAITKTLKTFGLYTEKNYRTFCDIGVECEKRYHSYDRVKYLQLLNEKFSADLDERFFAVHFQNLEDAAYAENPNIARRLDELSQHYELVLLSNYFEDAQRRRLAKVHLLHYFQKYYGEKITKPNREVFIDACENLRPEECVMIGDNLETDIKAASKCGLKAIYIDRGKGNGSNYLSVGSVEELTTELIERLEKED